MFVYTKWLKRSTPYNIVIGGAAGAVPPLVGWAAVTGDLSPLAWGLFAIIFAWTPPHFWALALLKQGEYTRAAVPMLPVVSGEAETRRQIVIYTVGLALLCVALTPLGLGCDLPRRRRLLLNGIFLWFAIRLYRPAEQARGAPDVLLFALVSGAVVRRRGHRSHRHFVTPHTGARAIVARRLAVPVVRSGA